VPRPPNAFLLFRSKFWETEKDSLDERDHRNISRMAATKWRHLDENEKNIWRKQAEYQKDLHAALHPNYKYAPSNRVTDTYIRRRCTRKKQVPPRVSRSSPEAFYFPSPSSPAPSLSSGSYPSPLYHQVSLDMPREPDIPISFDGLASKTAATDFDSLAQIQTNVSFGISPELIHLSTLPPQAVPFDADGSTHQELTCGSYRDGLDTWFGDDMAAEGHDMTLANPEVAGDSTYASEFCEPAPSFSFLDSAPSFKDAQYLAFSDPWGLSFTTNYDFFSF
jgi:hypothetical protein